MTAQASIPLKWYVPFANGDSSRVELPVTTADPTRASQTLGFPPLTMQPPESGGVPPQGEDFNGGMNQVARIAWWALNGGGWPYDSTFATNSNINGYPNGALIQSADFRGYWLNTVDNNQINPDTVGTGWVPAFQYGSTAIAGLTNANVTLTPAQASKGGITLAGVLTANINIVFPTYTKNWLITNNTTGAFAVTAKTAAGSGIVIPQNGAPTEVSGDGTNITQPSRNVAQATQPNQATPMSQATGVIGSARAAKMLITTTGASATFTADEIIVETAFAGARYCLANFSQVINVSTTGAGGMDTGSVPANGFVAIYAIYNPTANTSALLATNASTLQSNVYSGANMPAGYTASALVSVWRTSSSLLVIGVQNDREIAIVPNTVLSGGTAQASLVTLSLAAAIPLNAKKVSGYMAGASNAGTAGCQMSVAGNASNIGAQILQGFLTATSAACPFNLELITAQTLFYTGTVSSGTANLTIAISGYRF